MKNLGYASVALGALLSTTDLYGRNALDVLKEVNVVASEADVKDAKDKWDTYVKGEFNEPDSLLIDVTRYGGGYVCYKYNSDLYCCDINGKLAELKDGKWDLINITNTNVCLEKHNGWSHLKLNNIGNNQIGLWVDGNGRVVVDGANLNVLCGIIGDNVVTLGGINAKNGFAVLAKNYYSNFAYLASPWFCACTHYGSNFNTIDNADAVTGSNNTTTTNNFLNGNVINCLSKRGWCNYGTIRSDKITTDNLNYYDHGNTQVKKFTQTGSERNMFVKKVQRLTEALSVKIDNLSGTQNLFIEAGKDLGNNTYGYNPSNTNTDCVLIETDGKVNFESIPANANGNPQPTSQPHNEAQNDASETTQNETPITDNGGGHASTTTQEQQQVVNDHSNNNDNDNQDSNQQPPADQSNDNDNDNQNDKQQPPADQSNTNGEDDAEKIPHPAGLLDQIKMGVKLRKVKTTKNKNQSTGVPGLTESMYNAIKDRKEFFNVDRDSSSEEESSSSSSEF